MLLWITTIAIETAMRRSEIVGLLRSQVDLARRIVTLSDTKNASVRTVPLSRVATETFRLAISNPIRPIDTDLIFFGEPGKDGKRRPYEFRKGWEWSLKQAGIEDLHFHDLRHEAVSRLVESGLSDQEGASSSGRTAKSRSKSG